MRRGGLRPSPNSSRRGSPHSGVTAYSPKAFGPSLSRQDTFLGSHLVLERTQVDYFAQYRGHRDLMRDHQDVQGGPTTMDAASIHSTGDVMNMMPDAVPVHFSTPYTEDLFQTQIDHGPVYVSAHENSGA